MLACFIVAMSRAQLGTYRHVDALGRRGDHNGRNVSIGLLLMEENNNNNLKGSSKLPRQSRWKMQNLPRASLPRDEYLFNDATPTPVHHDC